MLCPLWSLDSFRAQIFTVPCPASLTPNCTLMAMLTVSPFAKLSASAESSLVSAVR